MSTRADVIAFAKAFTRDMNQLCQAWAWQVANRFGKALAVYPSAKAAYLASKIVSKDPVKAPGGAYHYWPADTVYGHVAPGTGPDECVMATALSGAGFTRVNAGSHLSVVRVSAYAGGRGYGGWSYTNGKNSFTLTIPTPPKSDHTVPKTSTAITGSPGGPGSYCWKRVQILARHGGYKGPIDGVLPQPGASWRGVQAYLKQAGLYAGDVDGDPRKLTYTALQRWSGAKDPTVTDSWRNIGRSNWRRIGAKLNQL